MTSPATSPADWKPETWNPFTDTFAPLRWRKPRMVRLAHPDIFDDRVSDGERDLAFSAMLACEVFVPERRHVFQVSTRYAAAMASYFAAGPAALLERWAKAGDGLIIAGDGDVWFSEYVGMRTAHAWDERGACPPGEQSAPFEHTSEVFPLKRLWLGIRATTQAEIEDGAQHLFRTPAAVRFVDLDELHAPIDLSPYMPAWLCDGCGTFMRGRGDQGCAPDEGEASPCCSWCRSLRVRDVGLDWIRVGKDSELGPVTAIVGQAAAADVPVFVDSNGCTQALPRPRAEGRRE